MTSSVAADGAPWNGLSITKGHLSRAYSPAGSLPRRPPPWPASPMAKETTTRKASKRRRREDKIARRQGREEGVMRFRWPEGTVFREQVLDVEQKHCGRCGSPMHICAHRRRRIYT